MIIELLPRVLRFTYAGFGPRFEKLSLAVRELGLTTGRIQERLARAATHLIQIEPQELSDDDMQAIAQLDSEDGRIGPDPSTFG